MMFLEILLTINLIYYMVKVITKAMMKKEISLGKV